MPPIPGHHETAPVEQLSLTDQDVELLHEIILRAEDNPNAERQPFRAVFAAYDTVLSENGIEAEKDRTYLRFLFLLGDRGLDGEGLYAKFESLLAQLGIQLEYVDGGINNGPAGAGNDPGTDAGPVRSSVPIVRTNGIGEHKGRSRRASFNSVYDLSTEVTQKSITRPSSRLSESRLDEVEPLLPVRENTLLQAAVEHPQALRDLARKLLTGDAQSKQQSQDLRSNGAASDPQNVPDVDSPPQVTGGSQAHRQINDSRHPGPSADDEDDEEPSGSSSEDGAVADHMVPSEFYYQPSLSHLLRDASIFNMYRQRSAVRNLFRFWAEQAKRSQYNAAAMEETAARHDQVTLLRQAWDIWRAGLLQKRQEAHTERFFKHLEERAARARDLYLLTKIFTHWGQVASEEMEKTSAARRHILSVKYFNAWREVTAVNELKIQRFTLKKPFTLWARRLKGVQSDETNAVELYNRNLAKRHYWCWFWSFCYCRAPQWREYRLKQRLLVAWLRNFRSLREREHEVDVSRKRGLVQSAFQGWSQRSRDVQLAEKDADTQSAMKLMQDNFVEWRIQRQLRVASAQLSSLVTSRLLRSSFSTWALRTRLEGRAREVDHARILRNAWTVWNDRLRYQALTARVNERMIVQTLYKWVLTERHRLMTRVHQQRVKREVLGRLMMNSRGLYTTLLRHEQEFRERTKTELLRRKFSLWLKQGQVQRQRELVAKAFYAPRVEHETLSVWRSRCQHLEKMEGWAKDARFYFLTMKTTKLWHAASLESEKRRRENAYTTMRRKVKVNLVTAALATWRSKASHFLDLERQADEMHQRTIVRRATNLFDLWVQATSRHVERIRDSDTYYNRQLVYNNLDLWVGLFRAHRIEEDKSAGMLEAHVSRVAVAQLRKLSLRLFEIRSRFETADAMNDRNLRKHFKSMIRRWDDRARESRSSRISQTPSAMTPASANVYGLDQVDEEDEWQNPDDMLDVNELMSQGNHTPRTPIPATPGYLNSPSKRASRARAVAQMSTTPATPLRTPFAGRLLSRGATTDPRGSSTKKSFVPKSALGVRFAVDEEEEPESPTNGRVSYRNT